MSLGPNPTPAEFAAAWRSSILEPAVRALMGRDGQLSRTEATRTDRLSGVATYAEDNLLDVFEATGNRTRASLSTMLAVGEQLAFEAAQQAAGADGLLSVDELGSIAAFEDDFRFLARHALELGVISDLDQTVIPPGSRGTLPAPYPGVAALYRELELAANGLEGDVRYVTARLPANIEGIPEYLTEHGLPNAGAPIETGVSGIPSIARAQKVQDISAILAETGTQRFVLFGDTAHQDPEVYRVIRERLPERVAAIVIHRASSSDPVSPERVEGMLLVENYAQAAVMLFEAGILERDAALRVVAAAKEEGLELSPEDQARVAQLFKTARAA